MNRNPYLFVVGCPRSGTTLLQRMLDAHPQLAVANDSHFIPRVFRKLAAAGDVPLTAEIIAAVENYHRFYRLGLSHELVERAAAAARTYAQFVAALYTEFARMHGKQLGGEKTPDYVRHLTLLHRLFPQSKFIHITRDGRDVMLSTLEWAKEDKGPGRLELWKEAPVAVCALWWKWQVSSGRHDAAQLPSSVYSEVRYDDLIASPEPVLGSIARFLDLPDAPEMARYYERKTKTGSGLSAKKAWLPPTQGLRDWRRDLSRTDIQLFEELAGDLLQELGYDRLGDSSPPTVKSAAKRASAWWASHGPGRAKSESVEGATA
jgi:hypothetical protein